MVYFLNRDNAYDNLIDLTPIIAQRLREIDELLGQEGQLGDLLDSVNDNANNINLLAKIGYSVKLPPYNAIGDGQSHKLTERFSSQEEAVEAYPFLSSWLASNPSVSWDTLEIDFCAIQQCLNDINNVFIPYGTFITNQTIVRDHAQMHGVGRTRSKIVCTDQTKPVFITGGVPNVSDLYFGHQSIPDTSQVVPNGTGIYLQNGISDGGVLQRLYIENVTSGIFLSDTDGSHLYSASLRDIRITRFRHSAMYIGGTGHTGNVMENIYAVNWNNYDQQTKLDATYGFVFKGMDDGICLQLNLEHGNYGKGVVVSGSKLEINSIHFEGYVANQSYAGLFNVDGTASRLTIRNASLVYSTFDKSKATDYSFLVLSDNGVVDIDGFTERDNTVVGSPTLHKFTGGSTISSGAAITAKKFRMLNNLFNANDYFPSSYTSVVPVVRQFNDDRYYWTDGGKRRFVGTEMPTSGTYNAGDEVININKTLQGTSPDRYFVTRWYRVTTGSSHVLNTDWLECREYVGS